MGHSTLTGIVTTDTSGRPQGKRRMPPSPRKEYSTSRRPIGNPRARPVFTGAHASPRRATSCDGISEVGFTSFAAICSPSLTIFGVHVPIGRERSCCQRNGVSLRNFAPFGPTMSPSRSGDGMEAMPVVIQPSSFTNFTVMGVQTRLNVTYCPPEIKKPT